MRATELSRAIVAAPQSPLEPTVRARFRERLVSGVLGEVERLPEGEELELTLPVLRRALAHPELLLGPAEPFVWQPRFARRSLGLAVVHACVDGRFHSPTEAVGPIASEAVDEWALTGWKTFFWEPWYAGLTPAGRAMVLAEAVSWATALWTSLDWNVVGSHLRPSRPDDRWLIPGPRSVRLKSRSELRVSTVTARSDPTHVEAGPLALVSVSGGSPSPSCADDLAFLALPALRADSVPLPVRVTGLWPEAGASRIVELDEDALGRAVDWLIAAAATLVDSRVSGLASR